MPKYTTCIIPIILVLMFTINIAQAKSPVHKPKKPEKTFEEFVKEFVEECKSNGTAAWFYDCECATPYVQKIVKDRQQASLDGVIKSTEISCQNKAQIRHPFKGGHELYEACTLLDEIKSTSVDKIRLPHTSYVWLDFSNLNVCKNREGINKTMRMQCTPPIGRPISNEQREAYCTCFADKTTESWMSSSESYGSRGSVSFATQAMLECEKSVGL